MGWLRKKLCCSRGRHRWECIMIDKESECVDCGLTAPMWWEAGPDVYNFFYPNTIAVKVQRGRDPIDPMSAANPAVIDEWKRDDEEDQFDDQK